MTGLLHETVPVTVTTLALTSTLTVSLVGLLDWFIGRPRTRRTLWQITALVLLILFVGVASGVGNAAASWLRNKLPLRPTVSADGRSTAPFEATPNPVGGQPFGESVRTLEVAPPKLTPGNEEIAEFSGTTLLFDLAAATLAGADDASPPHVAAIPLARENHSSLNDSAVPDPAPALDSEPEPSADGASWTGLYRVVALVWVAGSTLLLGRLLLSRLLLWFWYRGEATVPVEVVDQVAALSSRLGLRRPPRLQLSRRFTAPAAFGIVRPTIGLPAAFAQQYSPAEQAAVLAHELAHLAGRDPFWQQLAEFAAAVLWWQPLVWWARQRLRVVSEVCADEACTVIDNGPELLANCLVRLGRQLTLLRPAPWLAVHGMAFRSGLGRRVERLLRLEGTWHSPSRWREIVLRAGGVSGIVLLTTLVSALWFPRALAQGESFMSAMQNSWRHSLGAAVLTAVVGTVVPAAPPEGSAPVPVNPPGRAAAPVASPSPVKAKEVKVYTKGVADPSGQKVWVTSTVEGGAAQILEAKELRDLFVTATAEGPGSQDGPASAAALRELVQRQQAVLQRLMAMQEKLKAQLSNRRTLSSAKERATSLYEAKAKEALTEAQKQVKSGTERLQQELSLLEAEVAKLAAEAAKMAAADEELVLTITGDRLELADPKGKGRIEAKEFRITSPEPGTAAPAQAATPPANAPGKTPKSRRIIVHAEKGPAKQPAGASAGAGLAPAAAPPDVGLAPAGATGVPASVAGEPMSAATDVRVLELAIFKLKHANAATTRDVMADLLGIERAWASGMSSMGGMGAMAGSMAAAYRHPGGTSIAVHAPSNSIIVRGPADKIAMVKEVIARIDVPPGTEPPHSKSVRVIRLKHVPAAEILEVLSSLNIRRGIGVDQQTNAIIVTGQETQLSEIEQLAKALDVPQQPGASGQPSPLQPKESKR